MSAAPSADELRQMVKDGTALPAPGQARPGRYWIRDADDLRNAINAVGRAKGGEAGRKMVRRFIIKRAKALGKADMIPDTWGGDGSLTG